MLYSYKVTRISGRSEIFLNIWLIYFYTYLLLSWYPECSSSRITIADMPLTCAISVKQLNALSPQEWLFSSKLSLPINMNRTVYGMNCLRPLKHEIVGSTPTGGMKVCASSFCVCVVPCVGRGTATGWSHVQVLPTVHRVKELNKVAKAQQRAVEPLIIIAIIIKKLGGQSPRANYTDRAAAPQLYSRGWVVPNININNNINNNNNNNVVSINNYISTKCVHLHTHTCILLFLSVFIFSIFNPLNYHIYYT
jgi:hypothetical protein